MAVRETIIAGIETAFVAIKGDTTYPSNIRKVSRFDENVLQATDWQSPLVMILDPGVEEMRVRDATNFQFSMDILIRGFVKADSEAVALSELNNLIATIKQLIETDPSLGSNSLRWLFIGLEGNRYSKDDKIADTIIRTRVIYWTTTSSF